MAIKNKLFNRLSYIGTFPGSQLVDPLDTKILLNFDKLKTFDTHYVKSDEEGRPDLISYRVYRTVDLWWFIMDYNSIQHNLDIVLGLKLKIVPIDSLITYLTPPTVTSKKQKIVSF